MIPTRNRCSTPAAVPAASWTPTSAGHTLTLRAANNINLNASISFLGATALNPIDLYVRSGFIPMPLSFPYIIACDLGGTVEEVGPGASRFKPGDRVWGSNQGLLGRQGVTAQFAAVDEDWLYPTPAPLSDSDAAATALVGITAHIGLFRCAATQPGDVVFVNGGTGGVGSMVVQMARAVGAHVVTTVGSAEKAEQCRRWGAERVVNYKTDDVATAVRDFTKGRGVNVWYETQREPDFLKTVPQMARRGRIVVMAGRQAQPVLAPPVGRPGRPEGAVAPKLRT